MAQIQVNIDTEAKTLSVTIDGAAIPDVEDVIVYSYRDSNGNVNGMDVNLETRRKDDNGVVKKVSYYAIASKAAQSAIASRQTVYNDIKDFVGVESNVQIAKDIDEFLSGQRRAF